MSITNNSLISQYIKWFKSIFGEKIGKKYLNSNGMYKTEPFDFSDNRIKQINTNKTDFSIYGCTKCIKDGLMVRNQDAPGFIAPLSKIKYVIIGLEVNHEKDFHIAYDYYPDNGGNHPIFNLYKEFFPDIKDFSYITDIAKCRSTNLEKSRKNCFKWNLLKELDLLLRLNLKHDIIFILQGTGVRNFFKKYIGEENKIKSKKTSEKQLFSYTSIQIEGKKALCYIFPHSAGHTTPLWNEINEDLAVKEEIKNIIKTVKIQRN